MDWGLALASAKARQVACTLSLPMVSLLSLPPLAERRSHADAFRYHLEVTSGGDPLEGLPWWRAAPLRLAHLATSVLRTLWLLLLFGPVLLTAPVALQLNLARAEWIEMLRKTLEAAGGAGCRALGWGWGGVIEETEQGRDEGGKHAGPCRAVVLVS